MKLDEYLKKNHVTQMQFAKLAKTTQQTVSRWASGQVKPQIHHALVIEKATKGKVGMKDWK